ncbi:hypothetical protein P7D22_19700 [Lichenihabitans sp. Uapishka_5]|uniref:hypothetical protein n=1 Tax=Lichenihabitans sp. Uapishka_5 TaxID=3037302 RepID=UPI0029E82900|nr:hypothetical protein [Lichenihabitans sp. Uapishka_5]MDX7953393.1 hypothetical protein [Lichenihabitans sp. Uapishka_5]
MGSVLGIDPGATGAVALLTSAGDLIDVRDMPVLPSGPGQRDEISAHGLATIVREWQPSRAFVELVGPMPHDGAKAAFGFGVSKVKILATLAVLEVPVDLIAPAVWEAACEDPARERRRPEGCGPRRGNPPLAWARRSVPPGKGSRSSGSLPHRRVRPGSRCRPMIAASTFAPDQIVRLLARLNRGEAAAFSHEPDGPLAFTISKGRGAFVLRTPAGIALASGSTFAEVWRKRPQSDAAHLAEAAR